MASLIFMILVTGLSIYLSVLMGTESVWFDVFRGAVIGLFLSGIILSFSNRIKRAKELKNERKR
jgi:uncharacterized SAM-binding protein YcdF (DUF218 family)